MKNGTPKRNRSRVTVKVSGERHPVDVVDCHEGILVFERKYECANMHIILARALAFWKKKHPESTVKSVTTAPYTNPHGLALIVLTEPTNKEQDV